MKVRSAFVAALAVVAVTGCGHVMMMMHGNNVARPSASEFGTGPRASASRQFTATLQPDQPLRPRRMHTLRVAISDAAGIPAYLENSKPENRGFYRACGFESVTEFRPLPESPPLEAMLRQPRRS